LCPASRVERLACATRQEWEWLIENDGPSKIMMVDGGDEEMNSAINEARQSVKQFLDAFFAPKANQRSFLLKVAFDDQGATEHIWLADLDLDSSPPTGVVANEPQIRGLSFMQRVPFEFKLITDWMYYEDDCLIGGFTTRVLRRSARPN
jgi:uncharacterized protein YegJ (DUF2314 family)